MKKPIVAISGCLLGEAIRYDGQHKRHPHVSHEMVEDFEFQSFCPEVAMGLGIPRPTIKLIEQNKKIKLVNSLDPKIDHTDLAEETFLKIDDDFNKFENIDGIVLAKNSPSCGYDPIKVSTAKSNISIKKDQGLWAKYLSLNYPLIPKIDSGRLYDYELRSKFKTQVITYHTWKNEVSRPGEFVKFHETFKYYFLQYGAKQLSILGQTCSGVSKSNFTEKYEAYEKHLFEETFKKNITIKSRTNVIEHIAGYLKNILDQGDKRYLHDNIKAYHSGKLDFKSLIVLIYFIVKSHDVAYLKDQKIFTLY